MEIDVKDPKVVRWVIVAVLIVAVVPVYFLTTLLPITYASRSAEIEQLEQRHQKLSRDLEKARLLVRNLERVEREYEILSQQWEVAQTLLPELNEMPNLLRKVSAAGQQSGVEFDIFRPQMPIQQGFYADNPVSVKIQGGYHQTGVFLSRLANLNRILNVSKLTMKEISTKEETPYTVETEMTITAYTLGTVGLPAEMDQDGQQLAAQANSATEKKAVNNTASRAKSAATTAATH